MKIASLILLMLGSGFYALSQPTLTAGNINPIAGDIFYGHKCDTAGVTVGASGASAVWNFSALNATGKDTITMMTCASTPYCDSFPTSNIVSHYATSYTYESVSAAGQMIVGVHSMGSTLHINSGQEIIYLPLSYHSTHKDSNDINLYGVYFQHTKDSMSCDAFGTLILPTADTFKNVLRVHTMTLIKDSSSLFGGVSSYSEAYDWYVAGTHRSILSIGVDTAKGKTVTYYTRNSDVGVKEIANGHSVHLFPNPASSELNISFYAADNAGATVTVTDVMGKVVASVANNDIKAGENKLHMPLNLPDGVYAVRLNVDGVSEIQKIIIHK